MKKHLSKNSIMKFIIFFFTLSAISTSAIAAPGDMTICKLAGSWPLTIKTCAHDAGAICSLNWGYMEFLDDFDHGRLLQSKSSFDWLGEKFNPTEAGSSYMTDGTNPHPSSSILLKESHTTNKLSTETIMAFWYPVKGQIISNHILKKEVTIGAYGLPNVIQYLTQFTIPVTETHASGTFETVTGYMPSVFSNFWTFNPQTDALTPLRYASGEQKLPVILSTPGGLFAMGIYSPNSSDPRRLANAVYGAFVFSAQGVVKWNSVFKVKYPKLDLNFRSFIIVGSLVDVTDAMSKLHNKLIADGTLVESHQRLAIKR
ncbi:MAG: hypothetical protein KAH18_10600 [Psychromonas sp.]|nr:hypothetical protein [Psychromonas sp.]